MRGFIYTQDKFNALLHAAAKNSLPAKLNLRLAVIHTLDLSSRRTLRWVLSASQFKLLIKRLPEFRKWLQQLRVADEQGGLLLGPPYFEGLQERVTHYKLRLSADCIDLNVSAAWSADLASGYYDSCGRLQDWLDAFKAEGVSLSQLHAMLSLMGPQEAGMRYEAQLIAGIPWMRGWTSHGPIVQMIPAETELSSAAWSILDYTQGANPQHQLLAQCLESNDFTPLGQGIYTYVVQARVFNMRLRRSSAKARYQSDLSLPLYSLPADYQEVSEGIDHGEVVLIFGKYDPQAAKIGLDSTHHCQVIDPALDYYARQWWVGVHKAGLDPYAPQQREHFNAGVQRLMVHTSRAMLGYLLFEPDARMEVMGVFAVQHHARVVEAHIDGRPLQTLYESRELISMAAVLSGAKEA